MFSRNQKIFFVEFLTIALAVTLIMQVSGHFGPFNHLFFDNVSLGIIISCAVIQLIALAIYGKAPEMINAEQALFILKSAIAAVILIQIIPTAHNFSIEYASPLAFILLYCIAVLSLLALIFFGIYLAGFAILILFYSIARKVFSKKKPDDSKRRSPARRFFRAIAGFYIRTLILGIIFTGFVIDPRSTGLGALCFLFVHTFVNIIIPAIRKKGRARSLPAYIATAAIAILIYAYLHRFKTLHGMLLTFIYLTAAGGLLYSMFSPKSDWKKSFNLGFRELLAYALPVCLLTSCAFTFGMMKNQKVRAKELREIHPVGKVYDVEYDAATSQLYVTSRNKPNVLRIDPASGKVTGAVKNFDQPRRIAVFPEHDKVLVGSVYGTKAFSLDLKKAYPKRIFKSHTIDVEKMGEHRAILIQEIVNDIMIYNLATGRKKHITLPLGWAWMYAVRYSEKLGAFFISDWFFSPYVHRIEQTDYRKVTKSFNGFMNVGMCILPDSNSVLVARPLNRRVDILDAVSLKRKGEIPAEFGIREIDCDKSNDLLFTLAHFQGALSVTDVRSGKQLLELQVGQGARALSYDASTNTLYLGTQTGVYSVDLKKVIEKLKARRISGR